MVMIFRSQDILIGIIVVLLSAPVSEQNFGTDIYSFILMFSYVYMYLHMYLLVYIVCIECHKFMLVSPVLFPTSEFISVSPFPSV